ncbi:hypothetical protein CC86DRAFT_410672 [Ophiobolus disseminans]|uniref:Uncharacterized protein n=1 Tax=Ophiobolus disseminans TaxID=1469910 RepID=A0A6A6ZMJ2_9PLEO|nr:hypothetical protein CC86DRAFT_410672 [Ophiobolus disseminans]
MLRFSMKGFGGDIFRLYPDDTAVQGPTLLEQITVQDFKDGRNRRWGATNPEKFDIAFWNTMVKGSYSPHTARRVFIDGVSEADQAKEQKEQSKMSEKARIVEMEDLKKHMDAMDVNAESEETRPLEFAYVEYGINIESGVLPNGTVVEIGGEHEDSCDPDFMVYNDVIVFHPEADGKINCSSGNFDIYGYPKDVFPPTDGHTATFWLSRNQIIIGNVIRVSRKNEEFSFGETWRTTMVGGAKKIVDVKDDEVWALDLQTLVWTHQKSEWQTVPKKKQKKGRGHRAA